MILWMVDEFSLPCLLYCLLHEYYFFHPFGYVFPLSIWGGDRQLPPISSPFMLRAIKTLIFFQLSTLLPVQTPFFSLRAERQSWDCVLGSETEGCRGIGEKYMHHALGEEAALWVHFLVWSAGMAAGALVVTLGPGVEWKGKWKLGRVWLCDSPQRVYRLIYLLWEDNM